jgi:hypothetical protein
MHTDGQRDGVNLRGAMKGCKTKKCMDKPETGYFINE